MKKNEIIKKNYEISKIISKSKSKKNEIYSIFYLRNNVNRFVVSVPTKIGNAVIRNKIKRQVKSIIDNNKLYIEKKYDYVIIIKKAILNKTYIEKEQSLLDLFQKIGDENEK